MADDIDAAIRRSELIEDITTYRIGQRRRWLWPERPGWWYRIITRGATHKAWLHYAYRGTSDRWRRTWQAESEHSGLNAERAWTQRGAVRRMRRSIMREVARG